MNKFFRSFILVSAVLSFSGSGFANIHTYEHLEISVQDSKSVPVLGSWKGVLSVSGTQLPLIFNIKEEGDKLVATLDSPAQGAFGIPVDSVKFENSTLQIRVNLLQLSYQGKYNAETNTIMGDFNQGGMAFPMELKKEPEKEKVSANNRPQDPNPPYPYQTEDVTFQNGAITLAGTLSLPSGPGPFPGIVLVNGSGPQNRDSEILNHRPFHVLSDFFTKKGYAVLRYDDRGVGQSTGQFQGSTTYDFAADASAALNFLSQNPQIDKQSVGVIGHSEGGLIAPLVAKENPGIKFIVLLAGPGLPIPELLALQNKAILKSSGASEEMIELNNSLVDGGIEIIKRNLQTQENLVDELTLHFQKINPRLPKDSPLKDRFLAQMLDPWMQTFVTFPVEENLQQVTCQVLAINGTNDLQVTPENLYAIEKLLKSKGKVTIKEFPDLNHLFQTTQSGNPNEYGALDETFNPEVMEFIASWLSKTL